MDISKSRPGAGTGASGDENSLREKARQVVRTGTMPNRHPDQTWGGPGAGADCAICGSPVDPGDLELEIEFTGGDDAQGTYRVHTRCFAIWDSERRNVGPDRRSHTS